jgi:branched-chain amino acid aminotransferase
MSGETPSEVLEAHHKERAPSLAKDSLAKGESSFSTATWVWLNGELLPHHKAVTPVSAHGLHYGTGVFEGIRCYDTKNGPALFRMAAHMDRFFASAQVYGLQIPYTREELIDASCEVIRRNGFRSCYLRPLCYLGANSLGISAQCPSEVAIMAVPDLSNSTSALKVSGIRAMISSWVKFDRRMMPTTAKACGQYLNSVLAAREAAAKGFDEALLLNAEGNIAEAAVANVFLVREGMLLTNDESSSILPGITRDSVIELARSLGYEVQIGVLKLAELVCADEIFLTGTAREVVPVRELEGHPIGSGKRGPITEAIQEAFDAATHGDNACYRHWLHVLEN